VISPRFWARTDTLPSSQLAGRRFRKKMGVHLCSAHVCRASECWQGYRDVMTSMEDSKGQQLHPNAEDSDPHVLQQQQIFLLLSQHLDYMRDPRVWPPAARWKRCLFFLETPTAIAWRCTFRIPHPVTASSPLRPPEESNVSWLVSTFSLQNRIGCTNCTSW